MKWVSTLKKVATHFLFSLNAYKTDSLSAICIYR